MFNPILHKHPRETALLGEMVVGYGEIELVFAIICGMALEHRNVVLQAFHSIRTESGRISVGNALGSTAFGTLGLRNTYAEAYGAVNYCLKVRNQYAHSQWSLNPKGGGMTFASLDKAFEGGTFSPKWKSVTLELLISQEEYFNYTRQILLHLEYEIPLAIARRDGILPPRSLALPLPQRIPPPPKHIDL